MKLPPEPGCLGRRTLKIETIGDFADCKIKPRIRISGRWLEQAGFKPGQPGRGSAGQGLASNLLLGHSRTKHADPFPGHQAIRLSQ